ncbi:MAG: LysR family transcriptional regulator [Rhodobacteraceae bacterium]|nr:LysR family transcriptional regulator [Paracoccaceae bacterium]
MADSDGNIPHMDDQSDSSPVKIDILLLQSFHLVARTGSFSAAARELNISFQTAANHVRRLEQMYGARLLETDKGVRRVVLTPQGKALYLTLGKELDTILSRIRILLRDAHTVLRVGVPQALFHHFFPGIIHEFRKTEPDIELVFFERDTTLEQMMLDGSLDAAVSERSFGNASISQQLIGAYRLALIYPRDWSDCDLTEADLSTFSDRPFITYEPSQTIRTIVLGYLTRRMTHPPRITTTASGSTSITRLVEKGLGYAIVPEWSVGQRDHRIGRILLTGIEPVSVHFACSAFLESNPHVRHLYSVCVNAMSQSFSSPPNGN